MPQLFSILMMCLVAAWSMAAAQSVEPVEAALDEVVEIVLQDVEDTQPPEPMAAEEMPVDELPPPEAGDLAVTDSALMTDEDMLVDMTEDVMAAAAPTLVDPLSDITTVVCPFKGSIDYEPGRVKCGFIMVPENREVPDSRMIRLSFAHIVAEARLPKDEDDGETTDDDGETPDVPRDDPIIYLTGGPGVGIATYVDRFLGHDLTQTRDLYVLNQRGIGESGQFCPFFGDTSRELTVGTTPQQQELEEIARRTACFESAKARGVDVRGYNTVENARDVRALRRALGFDEWNVWGISYGSHLGQMLVQVDPDGISALVLDAIVPNDLGDLMRIHRWIERDFTLIFDECARQEAKACEDLEEDFFAAFNSLKDDPLVIPALDEELVPSGSVTIPPAIIAFAPFSMMYEQDQHPAIPAVMRGLIDIVEKRDIELLKGLTADSGDGGFGGVSAGMSAAVRCNDGYVAAQAEIAEEDLAENPRFAGGIWSAEGSRLSAQACVDAGLPLRDRADYQLVQSDIPTLIINGDWDPITPPALAERIAPGFSNGRLIIVPYAGHGPTRSMSECAGEVMTAFYDDPSQDLSALDAACFEEGVEAPEFLSYLQTEATLRAASKAIEEPRQLVMPGALAGVAVLTLVGGLILMLTGFLARKVSPVDTDDLRVGPLGTRFFAFMAAIVSLAGLGLIGVGAAKAVQIAEISLLAGFAPPAKLGALLVLVGGALGVLTVFSTLMGRLKQPIRIGSFFGLLFIGLAAASLAGLAITWDVVPW